MSDTLPITSYLVGPFGSGSIAPATQPVTSYDEAQCLVMADYDYLDRFVDVEGLPLQWMLHDASDYIADLGVCDGYPLLGFEVDGGEVVEVTT